MQPLLCEVDFPRCASQFFGHLANVTTLPKQPQNRNVETGNRSLPILAVDLMANFGRGVPGAKGIIRVTCQSSCTIPKEWPTVSVLVNPVAAVKAYYISRTIRFFPGRSAQNTLSLPAYKTTVCRWRSEIGPMWRPALIHQKRGNREEAQVVFL